VPTGNDIVTIEQYADVELRLEWKMTGGTNRGVICRATEEAANVWESGAEYQAPYNAGRLDGPNQCTPSDGY